MSNDKLLANCHWLSGSGNTDELASPELFQRTILLKEAPVHAEWLIAARGLISLQINGKSVTDELFLPGWSDYRNRLPLRKIEVTELLQCGDNTLSVTVAPGWYCGKISRGDYPGGKVAYGKNFSWAGVLHWQFADKITGFAASDTKWEYTDNTPLIYSDFYEGEKCDYRRTPTKFFPAVTVDPPAQTLFLYDIPPVKVAEHLSPRSVTRHQDGSLIVDFGKNIAGFAVLTCTAPAGKTITLTHGEALNPDGSVYTANLRKATGKSEVIWDGERHTYRPEFTFYGFRYCQISELDDFEDIHAEFVTSVYQRCGNFECSNALVNQLYQNIICSQQGNSLEIPMDCPQRNERLGWLGDIQVFIKTALYNFESKNFYLKYLDDVVLSANEKGDFPPFVPFNRPEEFTGSAGWADVLLSVVWELYRFYGEREILQKYHPALTRWLEHLNNTADNFIRSASRYGDWCAANTSTPPEFIATAYYARAAQLLAEIAGILGETELQNRRNILAENIRAAFVAKFTAGGRMTIRNQSAPVFALSFDLLPENMRQNVLEDLLEDIEKREYAISTGFLSTGLLLELLSRFNCSDVAGKILTCTKCPSLLYPVLKGATTIWEHWDGIKEDGSFFDPKMNSFNHYALGSYGAWFYEYLGGIVPAKPGFSGIRFSPSPVRQLDYVRAEFRGIKTYWKWQNNELYWELDTPVETEIALPGEVRVVKPGTYSGVCKCV